MKKSVLNHLKVVDIILEVIDSRVPLTGRIPDLEEFKGKERMLVFTKIDLSDPVITRRWKKHYEERGYRVALVNTKSRKSVDKLRVAIRKVVEKTKKRIMDKRMMVLGIPNAGKSSLINSLIHRKKMRVGNEPGITRGIQWVRIDDNLHLLDTPGILQRSMNSKDNSYKKLCLVGSIIPSNTMIEDLIEYLFIFLKVNYPDVIKNYCDYDGYDYSEFVEHFATSKRYVKRKGEIDRLRAMRKILKDSITGRMGNVSYDLI